MDYQKLLNQIKFIAVEQGELLEQAFKNPETVASIVKDNDTWTDIDVVTVLDGKVEERFYDSLSKTFPELGFNLEEHTELNDDTHEYTCFIDPIDGTKYFASDIPFFCISVGVVKAGEPVLGLVYDPIADQLYTGAEGIPSSLNGKPIHVSQTPKLSDAFLSLDVATHKENWEKERDWMNRKIGEFNNAAKRIRLFGAGALSCAWTASGGLDGFISIWGHGSKPFDIAAGKALIKYAGGTVVDLAIPAVDQPRFIGGNPLLVQQISELLLA